MLHGAPDLIATAKAPWVALHPEDADAAGIAHGDLVAVAGTGSVELRAVVTADQVPGTAWVPSHADGVAAADLGDLADEVRVTVERVAGPTEADPTIAEATTVEVGR